MIAASSKVPGIHPGRGPRLYGDPGQFSRRPDKERSSVHGTSVPVPVRHSCRAEKEFVHRLLLALFRFYDIWPGRFESRSPETDPPINPLHLFDLFLKIKNKFLSKFMARFSII